MFIQLPDRVVMSLEKSGLLQECSRWDSLAKIAKYYKDQKGYFVSYLIPKENLKSAYATPHKVLKLKSRKENKNEKI